MNSQLNENKQPLIIPEKLFLVNFALKSFTTMVHWSKTKSIATEGDHVFYSRASFLLKLCVYSGNRMIA